MKHITSVLLIAILALMVLGCGRKHHISIPVTINIDQSNSTDSSFISQPRNTTFSGPVRFNLSYTATGTFPGTVAAGDFNADGNPDFTYGEIGAMNFCFGDGRGGFYMLSSVSFSEPGDGIGVPNCMKAGDFNGDGRTDVAVSYPMCTADNRSDNYPQPIDKCNLVIFWGGQNVTNNYTKMRTLRSVMDFAFLKLNNDNLLDIMVVGDFGTSMVHYQTRNGDFIEGQHAIIPSIITKEPYLTNIVAGDICQEGKDSYIVLNTTDNLVSYHYIYEQYENSFNSPLGFNVNLQSKPQGLSLVDANNDGILDLITGFSNQSGMAIAFGSITKLGTKNFWRASQFRNVDLYGAGHSQLGNILQGCGADFNNDGKIEVAVADLNYISVLKFTERSSNAEIIGQLAYPEFQNVGVGMLATADFNRDGKPDLVTTDIISGRIMCMLNVSE